MARENKAAKDYLKGKKLRYSDDFYHLHGKKRHNNDFFSFVEYNALNGVKDATTNNYSQLFLTKRAKNGDNLYYDDLKREEAKEQSSSKITISKGSLYLYWADVYTDTGIAPSIIEVRLKQFESEYSERYNFNMEYIDNGICRISRDYQGQIYYLSVKDTAEWDLYPPEWEVAQRDTNETWSKQQFHDMIRWSLSLYDKNKWITEKVEGGLVFSIELPNAQDKIQRYYLCVSNENTLGLSDNINDADIFSLPEKTHDRIVLPIDESWVSYDNNTILGGINETKTIVGAYNQLLIHHEYNTNDQFNFIPLKNNITYQGNTIKGAFHSKDNISYRLYNSISSGFHQERGNESIVLNYTFRDQEYPVKAGSTLTFRIPSKEENFGLSPLLHGVGIETLPLNETSFVDNGAFGSDVPYFADKFKKITTNEDYDDVNNGTYLTSWLKRESIDSGKCRWVDRYYYPDIISRKEALLSKEPYRGSFENYPDQANDAESNLALRDNGFYDIDSNVELVPDSTYQYTRVSAKNVNSIMDNIGNYVINAAKNQKDKKVNLFEGFKFNSFNFRKIDCSARDEIHAVNFNTDLLIDPSKRMGVQLLGASHDRGLMIKNRTDIAPYHYYATEDEIYMLNNKHAIVHSLSLKEIYDERILKVLLSDIFENIVLVSPTNLYVLTYDLQLKMRVSLSPENSVIYGFDATKPNNILDAVGFSLKGYPYFNSSISLGKLENPIEGDKDYDGSGSISLGRLTSHTNMVLPYPSLEENKMVFTSNIASIIVDNNAILYNNNIYIPCGEHIVKLIFVNDMELDFQYFTEELQQEYPVYARIMQTGMEEVYYNLSETDFAVVQDEHLRTLHSIYIDDEHRVFGFNFDNIAMTADRNTIYGTFDEQYYGGFNSGGNFYHQIFSQQLSKLMLQREAGDNWKYSPRIEFMGLHSFDFLSSSENGYISFISNYSSRQAGEHVIWHIYDKCRQLAYQLNLDVYDKILTLDSYNYITSDDKERNAFVVLGVLYKTVYRIEWDSVSNEMRRTAISELPENLLPSMHKTNNADSLIRHKSSNALYFQLHTLSNSIFNNRMQIVWDISKVSRGWYNINVLADLDKGVFEVRVNDKIHGKIYCNDDGQTLEMDNQGNIRIRNDYAFFKPYVNLGLDLFNHIYYFGTIGKEYGSYLNEMLMNDELHDPYACKNGENENTFFITKRLELHEYQSMRLYGKNINNIILTLPCGIRNGIDEIVRFFKYSGGGAFSNYVKVNIDGHGLTNPADIQRVKNLILDELKDKGDALLNVYDFNFINQ